MSNDDTMTVDEAAALLGLTPRQVIALIDHGKLTATVVVDEGRSRLRFQRRDVERLATEP